MGAALGDDGGAVATAIGQAMTFLVCLVFFVLKKHAPSFQFDGEGGYLASRILGVGLSPFGLTYSPNITLILLNKSAVIFGGNIAVTCYAPISYISAVVMLLMQGVSDGSQPLISLAYGEGKHDTTKAVRVWAYRFAFGVAVVCSVVPFPAAGQRGPSVRRLRAGDDACGTDPADLHYRLCLCQRVQSDHRLFLCDWEKSLGLYSDLWGAVDALHPAPDPPKCHGECEWNLGFCPFVPNHCHAAQFTSNP